MGNDSGSDKPTVDTGSSVTPPTTKSENEAFGDYIKEASSSGGKVNFTKPSWAKGIGPKKK